MERARSRDRSLTALEESLMEENDRLAAENAEHRKSANEGDSMEVKTAVGSLRAQGTLVVLVLAIAAGAGFVAYMVRDHDLRNVDRAAGIVAMQRDTIAAQRRVEESLDAAAYILTLDERQRRELRLDMPDSLRKKVRDQR